MGTTDVRRMCGVAAAEVIELEQCNELMVESMSVNDRARVLKLYCPDIVRMVVIEADGQRGSLVTS